MGSTRAKDSILTYYTVEGNTVPVEVSRERRRNVRISCGVDKLYLRLPKYCTRKEAENFLKWGSDWAEKNWRQHAWFRERFRPKSYAHGQRIDTTYDSFELGLEPSANKHLRGRIDDGIISISYPGLFPGAEMQKDLHGLIHKLLGKYYLGFVSEKLHAFNREHFNRKVTGIRLSYQNTRWGSCSVRGRISLSTKLLFAPEDVLDYVIIHELAHLVEHNHSARFWDLVGNAMPGYQAQEKWLKAHGHLCD